MLQMDIMTNAINTLAQGGTILYPTDTIWGIGCDASNPEAVEKVYALKNRPRNKPFILLADSVQMVERYVHQIHPRISTLLSHHTRPLTVIYEKARNLPINLVAEDGSVAFRIPQDGYCRNLIRTYGKPLVATSANISNEPFPKGFGSISSAVIEQVDHVVQNRQRHMIEVEPSVIVRLDHKGNFLFIRK